MKKHIVIVSESAGFPWGMAAATRVRNLAKGCQAAGYNVTYLGLEGAFVEKNNEKEYRAKGVYDGIPYFYPGFSAIRSNSWLLRRLDDCLGIIGGAGYILYKKVCGEVDCILLYSMNSQLSKSIINYAHFFKIPVALEICEWLPALAEDGKVRIKKAERFCDEVIPKADGVLPISIYIKEQVQRIFATRNKVVPPIERIPILMDIENIEEPDEKNLHHPYLLYSGAMQYPEIAKFVIAILAGVLKVKAGVRLKFTGPNKGVRFDELREYAELLGVLTNIDFTGFVDEDVLVELMKNARCLLAPVPENNVSRARFPTKIGYYLATGVPVVTNAVGDIPLFLHDGENAFVVDRYNSDSYVKKVVKILSNPDVAMQIGLKGRSTAKSSFYYQEACAGLGLFFDKVCNRKPNCPE